MVEASLFVLLIHTLPCRWLKSSMPTPEISHLTKQSNFALIFTPKNIEVCIYFVVISETEGKAGKVLTCLLPCFQFQGISSDISGFTEHQNCRSSPVTKLDKTQLCTDDNYPSGNYRQSRPVLMRLKVYLRGVSPDHLFMLFRSPEQATTYQTADLANDDRSLWEKNRLLEIQSELCRFIL